MALTFPPTSRIKSQTAQAVQASAPHRTIQESAEFPTMFLQNIPQDQLQMRTITTIRQQQRQQRAQLLHTPSSNCTPYVGAVPKFPKRGVNSFMAFRAFYSRIFAAFQQKNSSTLIKLLWDEDPFRAKWSILARAYTSIRDHIGKEKAPIRVFLETVCPQIGIIGVDEYLIKMHWVIGSAEDGSIFLRQHSSPDFDTFPAHIMNTPMTEKDVTYYCAFKGYITPQMSFQIAGPMVQGVNSVITTPQQGLLATTPVINQNVSTATEKYMGDAKENLGMTSTNIFGFDFESTVGTSLHDDYECRNSNFDFYPEDGMLDLGSQFAQPDNNVWDTFSIGNPQELNGFFGSGGVQEGYFTPEGAERYEGETCIMKLSKGGSNKISQGVGET